MMRVLVLGGDGFVGRRVLAALARADGVVPVAGTRRASAAGDMARMMVDATDPASLARALDGIDAVVNCVAGDPGTIRGNAEALFAVCGARRVVHCSSMAVYGSATGRLDEDAPLLGDVTGYAAAKVAAELAALGADAVILRPGCIYGAGSGQWSLRIARLLAHRRIGDLGAGGDGCSNLVHVEDVAAAIVAALQLPAGAARAYNLAMPDAPDWNGYFLAFALALGMVPIRRIPGWQMALETKALAIPLKLAERATTRLPPPIPPSLAQLWAQAPTLDVTRATRDLGLGWTPLAQGLAEAAYWCAGVLRQGKAS